MDVEGLGTFLGDAGSCPTVQWDGHTYEIGWPTQRAKTALEELAAAKAVSEIRSLKKALPADAYAETFSELTSRIAAGDYRTWGVGWQRVVLAGGNAHLFLLTLLREKNPKITEQLARALAIAEPEQIGAALARVVPGFLSLLLDELPLQEEQRAAAELILKDAVALLLLTPPPFPTPKSSGASPPGTPPTKTATAATPEPQKKPPPSPTTPTSAA